MSEDKPFNAKEEIEKICEDHKIFFTNNGTTYEDLISVGLGNILFDKLSKFVKLKKGQDFIF
jgi:hypothetical protein